MNNKQSVWLYPGILSVVGLSLMNKNEVNTLVPV